MAPPSSIRRVKKACVSSSAIPSWWSTQPSKVTLRLKVRSPMQFYSEFGVPLDCRLSTSPSQRLTNGGGFPFAGDLVGGASFRDGPDLDGEAVGDHRVFTGDGHGFIE